jgi:hypothetical protein
MRSILDSRDAALPQFASQTSSNAPQILLFQGFSKSTPPPTRAMLKSSLQASMERAGKSLAKLKLSGRIAGEDLARAAWPAAVGKRLATHATATALVRGRLVVEVEDALWQKQLFGLRFDILNKLRTVIGDTLIEDIEFRIATPRRPPQVAARIDSLSADDADRILDSGMRSVYKQSRKKASA